MKNQNNKLTQNYVVLKVNIMKFVRYMEIHLKISIMEHV